MAALRFCCDLSWVTRQVVCTVAMGTEHYSSIGLIREEIQPDTGPLLSSEIWSRTLGCLSADIYSTKVSVEAPLMAGNKRVGKNIKMGLP